MNKTTTGKLITWSRDGITLSMPPANAHAGDSLTSISKLVKTGKGFNIKRTRKRELVIDLRSEVFDVSKYNFVTIDGVEFIRRKKARKK